MDEQRSVLITGASGGVGRAAVERFDELGWQVFAGVRSIERGAALVRSGRSVRAIELDITDERSVRAGAQRIGEAVGNAGLQGLINNAGIIIDGALEIVPIESLRRQFDVNVIGQVAVTQAMLPLLRGGAGRVINVGAASGRVTVPMAGPISASKTALESITDALRMELRYQGVHVSIIEPGTMETEIFAKAAAEASGRDDSAGGEDVRRLYAGATAAMQDALAGIKPRPVDGVVDAMVEALTARRPRRRYVVGRDARQLAMLRKVPEGLRDRLLLSNLGLKPGVFQS